LRESRSDVLLPFIFVSMAVGDRRDIMPSHHMAILSQLSIQRHAMPRAPRAARRQRDFAPQRR
jgi:hypothetical protein